MQIHPNLCQCVYLALVGSSRDQKTTLFLQLDLATKCCTRFWCQKGILPFGFVESASRTWCLHFWNLVYPMNNTQVNLDATGTDTQSATSAQSIDPLLLEHTQRIRKNAFLYQIYQDVYQRLAAELPHVSYPRILEIGSGGGFLKASLPHVITSDCIAGPGIDQVVDACNLKASFDNGSLDAITAYNVFHHLPNVEDFLRGAEHVLRSGGRIVLVEPWFTPVGQWFYRAIHHEPVILNPNEWTIQGQGRLGGANSRLPTSVFRDGQRRIAQVAPELSVIDCRPFHKWLYLLSGGLRLNTRVPAKIAQTLLGLDRATARLDGLFAIVALMVVPKR